MYEFLFVINLIEQSQQNKVMYNVHQYNQSVAHSQHLRQGEERLAKYLLRHQEYKEKACQKIKERANTFLQEQHQSPKHFVFEDDHFDRWRPHKQFRDVEDSTKFVSFKTFRHRPHYDMDKHFNQRERREIKYLSEKKEDLVKSKIIPEEQRGRSLRCQGPLNPKISFRKKMKDHEYLQPRLRFTNITDRQRMNESNMNYDDKFRSVYSSFEMTKSKLGRQVVSPQKKQRYPRNDSLDLCEDISEEMTKSKNFYYSKDQKEDSSMAMTAKLNPQNTIQDGELSPRTKKKMYFKLAKTMHLLSNHKEEKQRIEQLLKKTQYDRSKDMTNIKNNQFGQSHLKRPIL